MKDGLFLQGVMKVKTSGFKKTDALMKEEAGLCDISLEEG